jgi:N-acetylglucosamine kinase-like BadF-type ATPase
VLFVGVDVGGSRTRLVTSDGQRLDTPIGANLASDGVTAAAARIRDIARPVLDATRVARICAAVAGARTSGRADELTAELGREWPNVTVEVVSDVDAALAAIDGHQDRLALIAGTGAAAAVGGDGGLVNLAGGHGHLLGERGSGFRLGVWLHRQALELSDVGVADPPHADSILEAWRINRIVDLPGAVAAEARAVRRLASFAQLVLECAARDEDGCRSAAEIGATELVSLAIRATELNDVQTRTIGLSGGLFHSPWFRDLVSHGLQAELGPIPVSVVEPVVGALRIARQAGPAS